MTLYYCFPVGKAQSFALISERHINHLKKYIEVKEWDVDSMPYLTELVKPKHVFLHPIGYPFLGFNVQKNIKDFWTVRKTTEVLLGEDVADTDEVSKTFVDILNSLDGVVCNSQFTYEVYKRCGVETDMTIVSNGLFPEFYEPTKIENKHLLELKRLKEDGKVLMLFFLLHSPVRKGFDLLINAVKNLDLPNLVPVVKTTMYVPKHMPNQVNVEAFLSMRDIVALYDICDFVVVPSRGGSFELNVIEALSRGKPVITPDEGCFKEFLKWTIPVRTERWVKVFSSDNPVHTGRGPQIDIDDLANKIKDVAENIEYYQTLAAKYKNEVRKQYDWNVICKTLRDYVKRFI